MILDTLQYGGRHGRSDAHEAQDIALLERISD